MRLAILFLAAMSTSASAGDLAFALAAKYPHATVNGAVELVVDNFYVDGGIANAVVKFTNSTGRDVRMVAASCAFLDRDHKAIEVGKALVLKISAGQRAYDVAKVVTALDVEFASCRVDSFKS